jgi:hypothetical protein
MQYLKFAGTALIVIAIILTSIHLDALLKENAKLKDSNAALVKQLQQHQEKGNEVETKVITAQQKAKVIVQTKLKEVEVIRTQPIPTDCSATIWAIEHKGDLAW